MSNVTVKINYEGVGQILKSEEMLNYLTQIGEEIASQAGEGYSCRVHNSGQRYIANVYAETKEARRDNMDNDTLLRIIGG